MFDVGVSVCVRNTYFMGGHKSREREGERGYVLMAKRVVFSGHNSAEQMLSSWLQRHSVMGKCVCVCVCDLAFLGNVWWIRQAVDIYSSTHLL